MAQTVNLISLPKLRTCSTDTMDNNMSPLKNSSDTATYNSIVKSTR